MKILVISNNPTRPSFRQRIGVYLPLLRDNGIDAEVARLPKTLWARRRLFGRAADFDAVLLHKKKLNLLDAWALRGAARRIIYDFDDAVMYSPHRPDRTSRSHTAPFRRTAALADTVIAGNPYLAEHAKRFNANVHVVPTGLDVTPYRAAAGGDRGDPVRLVWIGSSSTLGYLSGIRPALEQLGRQFERLVLRIVCDEFLGFDHLAIEKRPWSEQTQHGDLATADIGLAPLPDNRFTQGKCGFKVLQYFAASLPVVASPVGVNAGFVQPGRNGFHARSDAEWVAGIGRLIRDAAARKRMGEMACETAAQFDLSVVGPRFLALVRQSLQAAGRA